MEQELKEWIDKFYHERDRAERWKQRFIMTAYIIGGIVANWLFKLFGVL